MTTVAVYPDRAGTRESARVARALWRDNAAARRLDMPGNSRGRE